MLMQRKHCFLITDKVYENLNIFFKCDKYSVQILLNYISVSQPVGSGVLENKNLCLWLILWLILKKTTFLRFGLEILEYGRRDLSLWPHGILYPQKFALTSTTSGSHSVSIVRSWTQATEFFLLFLGCKKLCEIWGHSNSYNSYEDYFLLSSDTIVR
jgi:hypothetical protein